MQPNIHTVNRELFEFQCLETGHAFQIRHRFDNDLQRKLSAIINEACNEIESENTVITIPSLEIDLGTIYFDRLEEEIVWAFKKSFFEKLSEFKVSHHSYGSIEITGNAFSFETLKHFLLTGHLPWFAGKQDERFLANLLEEVFIEEEEAFERFILSNLNNDRFIERLTTQMDTIFLERIISLFDLDTDRFISIKKTIGDTIAKLISFLKTENGKLILTDEKALNQNSGFEKEKISDLLIRLKTIIGGFGREPDRLTLEFVLKLIAGKHDITTAEKFLQVFENLLASEFDIPTAILHSFLIEQGEIPGELQKTINAIKINLLGKDIIDEDNELEVFPTVNEVRFYISNAGLILIANYLPAFFDQLKLLRDGNFIDITSQLKAVFLLHYLCTGKEKIIEYIVPLNKILCGLYLDEPLPQNFLLSEEEKSECEELLNAVIENWQKIGNMSIEGFREAFLNRDGIFVFENNQWILKVQREGYDVLLDSLPWSFNYTKLSWMQDLIITEW